MGYSSDHVYHKVLDDEESFDVKDIDASGKPVIRILKHGDSSRRSTRSPCRAICCALCCITGACCMTLVILVLLAVGGTFYWMGDVVDHLTVPADQSKTFPVVVMPEKELFAFKERVKRFAESLDSMDPPQEPLVITQDEINGLIGHSDYLRGHFYVTLTEDKWVEEYSLPADVLPFGKRDHFFVGNDFMKFDASKGLVEVQMDLAAKHEDWFIGPVFFARLSYLVNQDDFGHYLSLFMEEGSIFFGNPVPQDFIDQRQDLLADIYDDPDSGMNVRTVVGNVESVAIKDGALVVTPRAKGSVTFAAMPSYVYVRGKKRGSSSSSSDESSSSSSSSDSSSD